MRKEERERVHGMGKEGPQGEGNTQERQDHMEERGVHTKPKEGMPGVKALGKGSIFT